MTAAYAETAITRPNWRSGGTLAPFPEKPKRMRWHTYLRLRDQGMALEREIWAADARKLGCMED